MKKSLQNFIIIILAIIVISSVCSGFLYAKYILTDDTNYFSLEVNANYKATFNTNGGIMTYPTEDGGIWSDVTATTATKVVSVNKPYGELPGTPSRTGYSFAGWADMDSLNPEFRNLPEGFCQVEYIESTGTQYIDTAIQNQSDKVSYHTKFCMTKKATTIFGSTNHITNSSWSATHYFHNNGNLYSATGKTDARCSRAYTSGSVIEITTTCDNGSVTMQRSDMSDPILDTYTGSIQNKCNITLFVDNGVPSELCGNGSRIYYWQMTDNGTLVRDMVPAYITMDKALNYSKNGVLYENEKLPIGTVGMYDLVSGIFFVNAVSGDDFNKGPDIKGSITERTIVENAHEQTIYACWNLKKFKMTLTDGSDTTIKEYYYGTTYELPELERDGYEFDGWYDAQAGGTKYEQSGIVDFSDDITLYAHWTPCEYTVTFNPDGGETDTDSKTVTFGEAYGELPEVVKTGYEMKGWRPSRLPNGFREVEYLESTANGKQAINCGFSFTSNKGSVEVTYMPTEISLDGTRNQGLLGSQDISYHRWFVLSYQNRYTYIGSGEKLFDMPAAINQKHVMKVSADNGNAEIIFDGNKRNASYTGTILSGGLMHLFTYGHAEGIGATDYYAGRIYSVRFKDGDTLVRNYVPAEWNGTEAISYSKNGTKTTGVLPAGTAGLYDLVSNVFYINCSETDFITGNPITEDYVTEETKVTIPGDHILQAVWEPIKSKATFNADGGVISSPSETDERWIEVSENAAAKMVTYDQLYGELPASPSRTGYTFTGWFSEAGSSGKVLPKGFNQPEYIESSGNENQGQYIDTGIELDYTKASYKWKFGINMNRLISYMGANFNLVATDKGVGGKTSGVEYTAGQYADAEYTLANNENRTATINGKTIIGTKPQQTAVRIYLGALCMQNNYVADYFGSVKLYYSQIYKDEEMIQDLVPAVWNGTGPIKFSIKNQEKYEELASGTVGMYDMISGVFFINSGIGAFAKGDIEITQILPDTEVHKISDHNIFAQWSPNTYTFTLDDGTSTQDIPLTYDELYTLPTPSQAGYDFEGWYDAQTGGNLFPTSGVMKQTENKTLYAHWSAGKYTVTFNANGGTVSPASKIVTFGEKYGILPTPSNGDSEFKEWVTSEIPIGFSNAEYIVSSKTQYIDTGIAPDYINHLYQWDFGIKFLESFQYMGANCNMILQPDGPPEGKLGVLVNTGEYYDIQYSINDDYTRTATVNDESTTGRVASSIYSRVFLFALCTQETYAPNYYSSAQISYSRIYCDGELIQDLVPAVWNGTGEIKYSYRNRISQGTVAAGTAGFYDKVSGVFYINSGTGTLGSGGEIISSKVVKEDSIVDISHDHMLTAIWKPEAALTLITNTETEAKQIVKTNDKSAE